MAMVILVTLLDLYSCRFEMSKYTLEEEMRDNGVP